MPVTLQGQLERMSKYIIAPAVGITLPLSQPNTQSKSKSQEKLLSTLNKFPKPVYRRFPASNNLIRESRNSILGLASSNPNPSPTEVSDLNPYHYINPNPNPLVYSNSMAMKENMVSNGSHVRSGYKLAQQAAYARIASTGRNK